MFDLRRLCAVTCLAATLTVSAHAGAMSTGITPDPPPSGPSMVITEGTDEIIVSETTAEETLTLGQWLALQSNLVQTWLSVF